MKIVLMQVPNPVDFSQQWDELVTKLGNAIGKILTDWSNQVATNTATGLDDMIRPTIDWFRVDTANFVLHTPLELVNALSAYIGLQAIQPLLQAATGTALIVGAISYAGHYWWGWPGLGDSMQRIGVTVVIVGVSDNLLDLSLKLFDSLVSGIAASMPKLPVLLDINPIVLVVMICIWLVLLARLVLASGKRIAWLAVLKALAPLALMTMLHAKTAWIAGTFTRMWIGLLIGQVVVVMALALAAALVVYGGFGGYILSCACLMIAHDAVYVFMPKDAGPSISISRMGSR